jgi:hypothetical protein
MAATPKYGTMVFTGRLKTYHKEVYVSDVANAAIRFDGGGGAGASSPTELTFGEPVILIDYSQVTGTAETTKIQLTRNGVPTGDILRYEIHLTSLNNRPRLAIGIAAGVRFSANQLA